jgi:hypothetical protein
MPEPLIRFHGRVHCERCAEPLGLTLSGVSAAPPGERALLAFSSRAPAEFPDTLEDVVVERLDAHGYRIASAARAWVIAASAVHLHFEVAAPFYAALPPRRVPLLKRALWRVLLAVAASRRGLALLAALRR